MAVGGVGGMLGQVLNPGLDDRIATHLSVNPNPLAQQGVASQDPKAVDAVGNPVPQQPPQPGANLAPGAYTQPDPVNNSYIKDLMAAQRRDANAATFNEGMDQMAASFGTAQQQASKQAALRHGGGAVGDSIGDLAKMQGMQDQTITDNERARFMGNAATFAQTLSSSLGRPVSVQEATELMNNPDTMKAVTGAMGANATTTSTQKDADAAARAYADAHPEASPKDIADYKANLIAGGMGGSDLAQRQYLQERQAALAAGQKDFPDYLTWQSTHAATAAAKTEVAKQSQDFKDTATQDYSATNSKLTSIQKYVDILNADPDAAQAALKSFQPTTGRWAALDPFVPQKVKDAAVALQKIQASLSADQLANVKNVRNQREFQTLGQAATAGLNAAASPEDFRQAITDLKNKYLDAQATTELTVGHKLTGKLVGHGNGDLLSPTLPNGQPNPYYNGGSEDGNPLTGPDLDKVKQALADHPDKRELILDGVRNNGYNPRGL